MWNDVNVAVPPSMFCNSCQSASWRSNMCSLSFSIPPSCGNRELHSITGEAIRPIMKVTAALTAVTINTAPTARGIL